LCREKVGDLFTPNPISVASDMAVGDVISLMQRLKIGRCFWSRAAGWQGYSPNVIS